MNLRYKKDLRAQFHENYIPIAKAVLKFAKEKKTFFCTKC